MTPNPSFHRTLRDEAAQRPVNSDVETVEKLSKHL